MTKSVRKLLKEMRIDDAVIPGGCTKYIQAADISWNKPFKSPIIEFFDERLASGLHYYTQAGNMKPSSHHSLLDFRNMNSI